MNKQEFFSQKMVEIGHYVSKLELEKCMAYEGLLQKWQQKINLIGPSTINNIFERHILDAAQLIPLVPRGTVLDVGSGAGIPGLVLSIFLNNKITLCEKIAKKASFLKAAVRELGLVENCVVYSGDVLDLTAPFSIITARAVTSIREFLDLTQHCRDDHTIIILPKGEGYLQEVEEARKEWHFTYSTVKSLTENKAKILLIKEIKKSSF